MERFFAATMRLQLAREASLYSVHLKPMQRVSHVPHQMRQTQVNRITATTRMTPQSQVVAQAKPSKGRFLFSAPGQTMLSAVRHRTVSATSSEHMCYYSSTSYPCNLSQRGSIGRLSYYESTGRSTHPDSIRKDVQSLIARYLKFFKKHWFSLSFPPLILGCWYNPDTCRTNGTLGLNSIKGYALTGIFLATGLGIKVKALLPLLKHVKTHLFIQSSIFLAAPLVFSAVAYGVLEPLGMSRPLINGLIFTSCLPTTIATSLAFTSAAKGCSATSMLHVAFSNMAGIVITPAMCLALTGMQPSIEMGPLFQTLVEKVLGPVALGMALGYCFPTAVGKTAGYMGKVPQLCVLPLLALAFSDLFHGLEIDPHGLDLDMRSGLIMLLTCAGLNWIMMGGVYRAASALGLSKNVASSATFVGSQKTAALGVPLLSIMFVDDPHLGLMMVPLMCYHASQCALSSLFIALLI